MGGGLWVGGGDSNERERGEGMGWAVGGGGD